VISIIRTFLYAHNDRYIVTTILINEGEENVFYVISYLKKILSISEKIILTLFSIFLRHCINLSDALTSLMFTLIDYHALNECVFYVCITLIAINKRCVRNLTI